MIRTRKATIKDLPILKSFEQGIIKAERPFDITLDADPISYYDIEEMIHHNDVEVIVAEENNKIIASGYSRIEPAKSYYKHSKYAYLGFMYVLPEFRGKGVNQVVLDALIDWSKSRGINEVRLEVYSENEPALRAYEKAGFSKYISNMRRSI